MGVGVHDDTGPTEPAVDCLDLIDQAGGGGQVQGQPQPEIGIIEGPGSRSTVL